MYLYNFMYSYTYMHTLNVMMLLYNNSFISSLFYELMTSFIPLMIFRLKDIENMITM